MEWWQGSEWDSYELRGGMIWNLGGGEFLKSGGFEFGPMGGGRERDCVCRWKNGGNYLNV